ncbi:MAG: DUF3854 domain-containing protein [Dehalococcoidales bacterium]|nr:DUF3854 domain-containing protein [Dehalococcoidales bacterium]
MQNENGVKPVFSEAIPELLTAHFRQLNEDSGISVDVIKERGYRSLLGKSELEKLGFARTQCRTPGLLIPLWGVDGIGTVGYQFRPDSPRLNNKGKPIKYENPRGTPVRLDAPRACRELLGNPGVPIWFVEGVKKADSLASRGECSVTLTGVWNFKGRNSLGGTTVLADFDYIALKDRECYVCFDSDYRDNPSVSKAAARLAEHLRRKGARVRVVYLPAGEQGEKVGVDDFLVQRHSIDELKALATPFKNKEEEDHEDEVFASHFDLKGLWLEVKKLDGSYAFAHINGSGGVVLNSEAVSGRLRLIPRRLPEVDRQPISIVGLPDENIENARLLEPKELYGKVKSHIGKYVDLAELDLDLCTMYVLFTWFYRKVNTVAYLRFLADTGKGKTRGKKVIGDLCFYPLYASGASSFSGIARTQQQWRGTLVIDEADFAGEKENQITKYLNLGFERGQYYILSDKQDPRSQDYFDAFSPKVLAMREPFHDNATEGRLLSIAMHETSNLNIPIILSSSYYEEARVLRNELAMFALRHWDDIDATRMLSFDDLSIEPRLKQLAMPLSIIFQLWPEGVGQFRRYLIARQQEVRRVRSMSWEGSLVNMVIAMAAGDQEVGAEFSEYIRPGTDEPEAVTPSMVARQLKSSVKAITQALTSVGFQVEKRWITLHRESREVKKQVRAYTVPDTRTWSEITSRYYYADDGNLAVEIPQCLQSSKYAPSAEASHPSQVSQKMSQHPENVTVETDVTRGNTPKRKNGNKPAYPCSVCGSKNWWRRDGTWLCGRCHPEPQGKELFRLPDARGG